MNALKRFQMLGMSSLFLLPTSHRHVKQKLISYPLIAFCFLLSSSSSSYIVNAFDQLTRLAKSRKYKETAQALSAVKQLSNYFKSFENVDRILIVSRGILEVQNLLRIQVMKEFEEAWVLI